MTTLASMSLVRSPALTLTHGIPGLIYLEDLAPEGHSDGMIQRTCPAVMRRIKVNFLKTNGKERIEGHIFSKCIYNAL